MRILIEVAKSISKVSKILFVNIKSTFVGKSFYTWKCKILIGDAKNINGVKRILIEGVRILFADIKSTTEDRKSKSPYRKRCFSDKGFLF